MTVAALWVLASAVLAWLWLRGGEDEGETMGNLGICAPYVKPALVDDVRRGLEDSAAIVRLARKWKLAGDGRRWVGKTGPAFSTRPRP